MGGEKNLRGAKKPPVFGSKMNRSKGVWKTGFETRPGALASKSLQKS
jgi:hypothetical protein